MLIAGRVLFLRDGSKAISIPVNIYRPEKTADGSWGCRYVVGWPDKPSDRVMFGFDSVQALLHALQSIGAEIYSSSYHKSGQLFWDKPGEGYGFPVVSTLRDLLRGSDAQYL
jgi:hypothetical protein